jgi:sigma-B regulation protein RsbU (phosphoserine phosphatase)
MITAPIAPGEAERLAALHSLRVLDSPPEPRFDRITRLLTHIFHVPIAYVSLIDTDRQWFKSRVGLCDVQTARDVSFCGHAIYSDGAMIVPDATQDERFHDNPMVVGPPHIRFYAGYPLEGPEGQRIGTLCVVDRKPRTFSPQDEAVLRDLAQVVERELNLAEMVHVQSELLAAREQIVESQKRLLKELNQAAAYIRSLLPPPLAPPVATRWHFVPSSQLGGDCFGYDWLDPDHFAVYLLDVSGHGVGAALLAVSVMNALRAQALPGADFRTPASVLAALNQAFPMEGQNGKYFTMWYGVFHLPTRQLRFSSAGHPPPLLVAGRNGVARMPRHVELHEGGFPIGMVDESTYATGLAQAPPGSRLFLFSDGVYEVARPSGLMMHRDEFTDYLASLPESQGPADVWDYIQGVAETPTLRDDFSLLELRLT